MVELSGALNEIKKVLMLFTRQATRAGRRRPRFSMMLHGMARVLGLDS